MAEKQRVIIKNVRCVYPNLHEPKAFTEGDLGKYSTKFVIPKSDKAQIKKLTDAIKAAIKGADGWSAAVKTQVQKTALDQDPYNDYCIIKDGDEINARRVDEGKEAQEAYAGNIVVGASRSPKIGPPTVVDKDNNNIPVGLIAGEIIGGYYINVQVEVYCYSKPKQGCTLSLQAVQKVSEAERFGASSPFEALEESDVPDEAIPF